MIHIKIILIKKDILSNNFNHASLIQILMAFLHLPIFILHQLNVVHVADTYLAASQFSCRKLIQRPTSPLIMVPFRTDKNADME